MKKSLPRVNVAVVHYRSGGMILDLVSDLARQRGVELSIHVVESGSDGSAEETVSRHPEVTLHRPGRNVGYAGGNNLAFGAMDDRSPVLVVNPDVRITDRDVVAHLLAALQRSDDVGAVAPLIRDEDGQIEYQSSLIDRVRAIAVHTETHLGQWGWPDDSRLISWLDGACLLLRREAIDDVGGFDERYFLIAEEVDWCLRAGDRGWQLLLCSDAAVRHQRSSSFEGSTKSAYYATRNNYLLFRQHGAGRRWQLSWALRAVRTAMRSDHRRSGASAQIFRGMAHALLGITGAAPEDRPTSKTRCHSWPSRSEESGG